MNENKPSLYNLTAEYQELYNKLWESIDEETGEVDMAISNALEAKGQQFLEKAVAVATVYRKFDSEIALYEAEIKRLTECKKRLENCRDRLKDNLANACQSVGVEKIDGVYAKISFRTSESVEIDDIDLIPEEYLVIKSEVKPDKTAIKNAIKSGRDIRGVHIEKTQNIQIK